MLKHLIAAAMLAACLPAWAGIEGNEQSTRLVQEAHLLRQQGKFNEAFDKYQEAVRADASASLPLSAIADMLHGLSENAAPADKEKLRAQATQAARAALQNAPQDPIAQEVLRKLQDDTPPPPLHKGNAAAEKAHAAAELAFTRQDWDGALKHYREAMAADPRYSAVFVGAGDCYYVRQQWPQAEELFRQAATIEPRNAQAWRFLADALARQGKVDEADDALLAAIAAHPAQRPTWDKLGALRSARGQPPLAPLGLKQAARFIMKDGQPTIDIDRSALSGDNPQDLAIWIAQATFAYKLRNDDAALSPFQLELQSWTKALQVADEVTAKSGKPLQDAALLTMQELHRRHQLEPALLLLRYREAYRAELEAWLGSRPHAVREFVLAWGLRP